MQSTCQMKVNRFLTVRLFRKVNMPVCSEDPKTRKDVIMMETAWSLAGKTRGWVAVAAVAKPV